LGETMKKTQDTQPQPGYFLGCPMWANRAWQGSLLRKGTKVDLLGDYSAVLSAVEGNTTFYGLPKPQTVAVWREQTPPGFRFCFKFPKKISHDLALKDSAAEVAAFLERLAPLERRLGPFFLQLPSQFDHLPRLARFLEDLPGEFNYAVEVRHPVFFEMGPQERELDAMLGELKMDRVLFDTERLMAYRSENSEVKAAQRKKPRVPRRMQATGHHPFLRYVGFPDVQEDEEGLVFWAEKVARWVEEGRRPYVFLHQVPEDDDAPQLCRRFHQLMKQAIPEFRAMAEWPGEREAKEDEGSDRQLSLF